MKYSNGLTSILMDNKNSLTASVIVFVRVGSVNEKASQAGLSHFIEHLMFKGSKNYPGDSLSKGVENFGGEINAATSKEFTMYYINMQKDFVGESLKMLADTLQNPLFPEDEINKERKVVIEEIQRHFDNPLSVLYERFYKTIYKGNALRNSIIGTHNVIANVSLEEIERYYRIHYIPEKMVVAVSGGFERDSAERIIDETFGKFVNYPVLQEELVVSGNFCGNVDRGLTEYADVELGYMFSGFLASGVNCEDVYLAYVAADILGGGKSSRLYKCLYEEKHLVYAVESSFSVERNGGNICIISVFDPENADKIKIEIEEQINDIIVNGISEEELKRTKLLLKTDWQFSNEVPYDTADKTGYWSLMGNGFFVEKYIENIEKFTVKNVAGFFKKYYSKCNISHVAVLPGK